MGNYTSYETEPSPCLSAETNLPLPAPLTVQIEDKPLNSPIETQIEGQSLASPIEGKPLDSVEMKPSTPTPTKKRFMNSRPSVTTPVWAYASRTVANTWYYMPESMNSELEAGQTTISSTGWIYRIDYANSTQTNVSTGQVRQLIRIQPDAEWSGEYTILYQSNKSLSSSSYYHRYSNEIQLTIANATELQVPVTINSKKYELDFSLMRQVNLKSGRSRRMIKMLTAQLPPMKSNGSYEIHSNYEKSPVLIFENPRYNPDAPCPNL
jgi:hypothetical protein